MKSRKGGYKLVSLQLVELTTMTALLGLYGAIVNSHDKPLLISDIVIDGERKNNVYCRAEKGTNKYTIKNVYGYDIEVTNADAVEVTENADGIELPKPTPEDDGSIVGVNVQGKYVLKPNPLVDATQADNGKVLEVTNGAWGKGGKKVNVIDAPESTTLDDDTIAKIENGVFINGTLLGIKNPILSPTYYSRGLLLGVDSTNGNGYIATYIINNKVISIDNQGTIAFSWTQNKLQLNYGGHTIGVSANGVQLNGKNFPAYPINTGSFTLKCVDGELTWVQDQ